MAIPKADTEDTISLVIKYKGVFDIDALYKTIYDWLISRGYQVHESKFKSIDKSSNREYQLDWGAFRKVTEFVMAWIYVHYQFCDTKTFEVVKDGEKKTLTKGLVFIRLRHELEYDYSHRFTKSPLHTHITKFFKDWMYRKKIDTLWEDKLRFKLYELQDVVKQALESQIAGNEHYDVW